MSFDGALIKEQGVTFAIAVVKPSVLTSPNKESIRIHFLTTLDSFQQYLWHKTAKVFPTYDGRRDLVKFLSHIHPSRIPWKHYTLS